jgi:hypothetical protein
VSALGASEAVSAQTNGDDFERRFARVESLLSALARSPDASAQEAAREVLSTVLELHQRGLARLLELVACDGAVRQELASDARVSAMLLLHDLHPQPLDERVARTLQVLRARYRGKIDDLDAELTAQGELRVRLRPAASACGSTRQALLKDVEDALIAAAPEAASLRVEAIDAEPALIQLRLPEKPPQNAGPGARK